MRSAAAASALPPPSPAATGMRLSISQLERRQLAPRARAERRAAPAPRGSRPPRPGTRPCPRPLARRGASSSSASSSEANSEQIGCMPSSRGRTDVQDEVELRVGELAQHGREATHGVAAPRAARGRARRPAAPSPPAAGARRGRRPGGRSARGRRAWRRGCRRRRSGRERQRAGQRLAPVGEAGVNERHAAPRRRRAAAAQHHERGVHVRLGVEHGARHLAEHAHLAGELGEHRGRAVALPAGRRREPLRHLALHHRHPQPRLGQLGDRLEQHGRRDAVRAGSPRPCRAAARARRGRASPRRPGGGWRSRTARAPRAAAARASGPPPPRAGAPPAARGTPRARRARRPPRAPRRPASSSAAAPITPQHVVVDQEVLAELAVRADAERAAGGAGCLARLRSPARARARRSRPRSARAPRTRRRAARPRSERCGSRSPARSACRAAAAARGRASRSPPAAARPGSSRAAAWRSVAFG